MTMTQITAIDQVFRHYFVLFGSDNQEVVGCVHFLAEKAQKKLSKMLSINLPVVKDEEDCANIIEKDFQETMYKNYRLSYLNNLFYTISNNMQIQQSAVSLENQVEFAAHSNTEIL